MTESQQKGSIWTKIHIDPTFLLLILALLVYSAFVMWSASGQDIGMMERKIGQIVMGLIVMAVMAQIPPRVYESWAPYLYIFCVILLIPWTPSGRSVKARSAGWISAWCASSRRKSPRSPCR